MSIQTMMLPSKQGSPTLEILRGGASADPNRPPILFVHGYTSGAWQFAQHWMPALQADGWDTFAVNLRGHGGSEGREAVKKVRFKDYAADVSQAVGYVRMQTGTDPILVGHSLGSVLARDYAATHPVAGLGLLSFGDIGIGMKGFMGWMMRTYPVQGMVGMVTGRPSAMFAKFDPQYEVMYAGHDKDAIRTNVERLMAQPDSDKVFMELSKLKFGRPSVSTPILIMAGSRDPIASVKAIKALGNAYQTDPIVLDGKAHDIVAGPDWNDGLSYLKNWLSSYANRTV